MVLRGVSGEAALNPWRQVARAACNADRAGRAHAPRANALQRLDRSCGPICFGRWPSVGGPRKWVDRGDLEPVALAGASPTRVSFTGGLSRDGGSCGGIASPGAGFGLALRQAASVSGRRRGDCATGGARADRVGAKLHQRAPASSAFVVGRSGPHGPTRSRWRAMRAKAAHPLTREHSADGDRRRVLHTLVVRASASSCVAIGVEEGSRIDVISTRRSMRRMGPQPHRELAPSPARAGHVESTQSVGDRTTVVVLASCSDCRGRRETPGPMRSFRGGRRV